MGMTTPQICSDKSAMQQQPSLQLACFNPRTAFARPSLSAIWKVVETRRLQPPATRPTLLSCTTCPSDLVSRAVSGRSGAAQHPMVGLHRTVKVRFSTASLQLA